jgi:hypothetical protein
MALSCAALTCVVRILRELDWNQKETRTMQAVNETPSFKLLWKRIVYLEDVLRDAKAEMRYMRKIIDAHGTPAQKRMMDAPRR